MPSRAEVVIDGQLARLTLLQGDIGNPLDSKTVEELNDALRTIRKTEDVRAVLFSSRGRNFCFGGNFKTMSEEADLANYVRHLTVDYHDLLQSFLALPVPIVSAIRGGVAGAGVALALMPDYVIVNEDAHFTVAFARLGATPDGGTTFFLPRLIGMRKFQELLITNRRVRAAESVEIGMTTEMTSRDAFDQRVNEVLETVMEMSPGAIAASRLLLLESSSNDLRAQFDLESRALSDRCNTQEMQQALQKLVEAMRR